MANYLHRVVLFDKNDLELIQLIGDRLNNSKYLRKSLITGIENSRLYLDNINKSFHLFYFDNLCNENYCDYFELNQIHYNSDYKIGLYLSKVIYESKSKVFGKYINKFTLDLFRSIPDEKIIFMNLLEISKFRYIFKDKFIQNNFKQKQL